MEFGISVSREMHRGLFYFLQARCLHDVLCWYKVYC